LRGHFSSSVVSAADPSGRIGGADACSRPTLAGPAARLAKAHRPTAGHSFRLLADGSIPSDFFHFAMR